MTTSAQAHMVINLPHTPGSVGALSSAKKLNGLNYYWNRYNMTDDRYDKPLPHKLKKKTHISFVSINRLKTKNVGIFRTQVNYMVSIL